MARIQGAGYRSHTAVGWGMGTATLYPVREAVTPEQLERIAALPHLAGLAQLNRLVVPERIDDAVALRSAAAAVHADMLLGYTFDTTFGSKTLVPALGVITLGLFPNERARVTSRAAAALLDTRTGYVYGLAEATERVEQLANAWTTEDAIDDARQRAERDAFASLVGELETMWTGVVARHAGRPADVPTDAASPDLRPAPPGATYPAGP